MENDYSVISDYTNQFRRETHELAGGSNNEDLPAGSENNRAHFNSLDVHHILFGATGFCI
jgi:hypothetical protein